MKPYTEKDIKGTSVDSRLRATVMRVRELEDALVSLRERVTMVCVTTAINYNGPLSGRQGRLLDLEAQIYALGMAVPLEITNEPSLPQRSDRARVEAIDLDGTGFTETTSE
jgi:hypothetical protein